MQYDTVKSIEFKLLSSQSIRQQARANVLSTKDFHGKVAADEGLFDLRLGSIDFRSWCSTCQQVKSKMEPHDCRIGHPGYFDLVTECFHPGYLPFIVRLLHMFCYFCSSELFRKQDPLWNDAWTLNTEEKIKIAYKLSKSEKNDDLCCPTCHSAKASYKKKGSTSIERVWKEKKKTKAATVVNANAVTVDEQLFVNIPFSAKIAKRILFNVSNENFEFIGVQKSFVLNCIMECMTVMAPTFRPIQDDLTIKLSKIREANEALKNYLTKHECWTMLNEEEWLQTRFRQGKHGFEDEEEDARATANATANTSANATANANTSASATANAFAGDDKKKKRKNKPIDYIRKHVNALQFQIGSFFCKTKLGDDIRNKVPASSIMVSGQTASGNGYGMQAQKNSYVASAARKSKNIDQRLKGKPGRFRSNLSGKRVDFSGRVCITPDSTLDLDEVGLPVQICIVLTKIEIVNSYNIAALTKRVQAGYGNIKGARSIWYCKTGATQNLAYCDRAKSRLLVLHLGDKVERYLQNGDVVLMNRQPSLHKMSIMAHRVVVVPESSIRLNLTVTTPYNADFDGDEMNVHICQSMEANVEASELVSVSKQSKNAQNNKPVFGFKQDPLLQWYLMSSKHIFITRSEWMSFVQSLRYPCNFEHDRGIMELPIPAILKPEPLWTGKQLFSFALPSNFDFEHKVRKLSTSPEDDATFESRIWDPKNRYVIVRKGELLCGQLCKETLGATRKSIFHHLCLNYSGQQFTNFVSDTQRLANEWGHEQGFTVGLDDVTLTAELNSIVQKDLQKFFHHIKETRQKVFKQTETKLYNWSPDDHLFGSMETKPKPAEDIRYNQPRSSNYSSENQRLHRVMYKMEPDLSQSLNRVLADSQSYLDQISPGNSVYQMVTSGSKGTTVNLSQMNCLVGQNAVGGQRLHPIKGEYPGYDLSHCRALPCFDPYDSHYFRPENHGFIAASYRKGLSPSDFFQQTQAGRDGLIDTAVKASDIGYTNRRVVKASESIVVQYDKTVRDISKNRIIQFCYGGDNLDGGFIQQETLDYLGASATKLKQLVSENGHDCKSVYGNFLIEAMSQMSKDILESRQSISDKLNRGCKPMNHILISVDIPRKLNMIGRVDDMNKNEDANANANEDTTSFNFDMSIVLNRDVFLKLKHEKQATPEFKLLLFKTYSEALVRQFSYWPTLYFRASMLWNLAVVYYGKSFALKTNAHLTNITEYIVRSYISTVVQAGEMAGLLSAASVGAPLSQMTFNTFHLAGLLSGATSGFSRVAELTQMPLTIKTPYTRMLLQDGTLDEHNLTCVYLHQLVGKGKIIVSSTAASANEAGVTDIPPTLGQYFAKEFGLVGCKLVFSLKIAPKYKLSPYRLIDILRRRLDIYNIYVTLENDALVFQLMNVASLVSLSAKTKDVAASPGDLSSKTSTPIKTASKLFEHPSDSNANMNAKNSLLAIELAKSGLLSLQTCLMQNFLIQGLPGISGLRVRDLELEKQKFQVAETIGSSSNLALLWLLDNVKWQTTVSNNLHEINSLLGIEAASHALFNELKLVLGSFGDSGVDERHILLLMDIMTNNGFLMPLTRFGYKNTDMSTFQQASFEKQPDVLYEAAFYGCSETYTGVSTSIFLGQSDVAPFGTGICDAVYVGPSLKNKEDLRSRLVTSGIVDQSTRLSITKQNFANTTTWDKLCNLAQTIFVPAHIVLHQEEVKVDLQEKNTVKHTVKHEMYIPSSPRINWANDFESIQPFSITNTTNGVFDFPLLAPHISAFVPSSPRLQF